MHYMTHSLRPTSTPHLQSAISQPHGHPHSLETKNSPSTLPLDLFPTPHTDALIPPTPLLTRSIAKAGQGRAAVQDLQRRLERVHRVARTLDRGGGVANAAGGEDAVQRGRDGETESCERG